MIRDFFRTVATLGAILTTGVFGPAAIVAALLKDEWADPVIATWARGILGAAGVKIHVRGLEHLPAGTCVLVSNHQSNFDPPLIVSRIPKHTRFVAKAELFRVPFLGQAMKVTGNIRVERKGSEKDRRTLAEAVESVREKVSVMFFPEGTRSKDGTLRPFKKGAAAMAIAAQVPVVPMAIAGTAAILPPGSAWIRGGRTATLVVGEPRPTAGLTEADRESLTEQIRADVAKLLEQADAWVKEVS